MLYRCLVACVAWMPNPLFADARPVPRAAAAPVIDGVPDDPAWAAADWRALDEPVIGGRPDPLDFSGRYKLLWTPDHLYLLAEIADDVLYDSHADPHTEYWNDDALEIFVDEDASGGGHRTTYNAFAYHVALDNQAVDIGPPLTAGAKPVVRTYPRHVMAAWRRSGETPHPVYWEVRIAIFDDTFSDAAEAAGTALPVQLHAGKELGFMLAWCDADDTGGRTHFIGDVAIEPIDGDRNRGYIDAGVFATIRLAD